MIEQYTSLYSNLDQKYAQSISGPYQDLSYLDNDTEVVASVRNNRITGFWRPAVLVGKDTQQHIERLWNISPDITAMDYLEGGGPNDASKFLLQNGFEAESYYYQVIDLYPTQDNLWHDVRKSYRPLISKDVGRCVLCKNQGQWAQYMRLHMKVAGRQTRSKESWQIQWQMIEEGQAYAILMYDENAVVHTEDALIAGALFMHNSTWAYYASGKSVDQANSHAVIWKGIEVAKQQGIHWMDMGEQVFWGSPKLINIGLFKRGFGGTTKMRLLVKPRNKK